MRKFKLEVQRPIWEYWGFEGWTFDIIPQIRIFKTDGLNRDGQGRSWQSYGIGFRWLFLEWNIFLSKLCR